MAITLPTPWAAGEKIKPSRLNSFITPIQSKFAGNIRSDDMASDAGIKGGQISSASGTRITNANLENNSVDTRALKTDATAGRVGAAVKRDNIVEREILGVHVALATISKENLKVTEVAQAFSIVPNGGAFGVFEARVDAASIVPTTPVLPLISAMLPLSLTFENLSMTGAGTGSVTAAAGNVYDLSGVTRYGIVFRCVAAPSFAGAYTVAGTIRFRYLALT